MSASFALTGQEVSTQLTLRIISKMKTLILLEALQSTNALQCVIIFGSNSFPPASSFSHFVFVFVRLPGNVSARFADLQKSPKGKNAFCCFHLLGAATQLNELSAVFWRRNSSDSKAQLRKKKNTSKE